MMKVLKQLLLACLCLIILAANIAHAETPQSKAAQPKLVELDRIVAVVNNEAIMQSELDKRMQVVRHQLAERKISLPPENIFRKQVLDQLIIEDIQLQIAKRAGITINDLMLNDAIEKIAQRYNLTVPEFKKKIEKDGMTFAEARENIRQDMMLNRVRQRLVGERIHITPKEIDNFLNSPEGKSQTETTYRLGHILIATPDNASAEQIKTAKKKAQEIVDKLRKGANFPEMAVTYSQGQNALKGGDLGWRKSDQLPTLFYQQVLKMKKGEISGPIRSPNGFHIFKLIDLRGDEKHVQEQVHVRHILIKPNEIRSNLEAEKLAQKLYKEIKGGANFAELAKAYSDDTASALNGGDLSWVSPNSLVPEFRVVINHMPLNQISKPFKTAYGWHILEVLGKRDADISDQVRRKKAQELLANRKFEQELAVWLREIRDQAYVNIRLKDAS
ncbi:MAG: peptidylprolyl isomerase [Endozoicomonas sp. (ex Botrylloides leachii)]|nr:peptidylprolyl isomerase [Endozoicomonas sp. (ex Botrylloides leachii)]